MTYPPNQGPYGQPHQPPHGQGGYPYQYPQQPGQFPGQYPGGPPPRKNKTGLIAGLVALGLVVVVGVVLAIVLTSGDDKAAAPPSSSAAAPPPSSSPSSPPKSSAPKSSSAPSGGGIPAADASTLQSLSIHLQSNLNYKNVDGLLIKVCSPADNKEKARADVLEQLPMMDPANPEHERRWNFGVGVTSKASGEGYQIAFQGSFNDAQDTPISVTFKAYVDDGKATWCGMKKGG
ncbi:hypothetical protein [Amycolatopsis minnesotensis]|uniref:Uncharacterized protein n=1 Tax=Amycolatopsis minnesotensis TaxID=337894 RepID=A0ABP5CPH5_9PSEU